MKPGMQKGARLSARDKREIQAELVRLARQTGTRAYTFRWDGEQLKEFRAWPDNRMVGSKVGLDGVAVEPQRRMLYGVQARALGAAVGAVPVLGAALALIL